jgi:hypothetical protein
MKDKVLELLEDLHKDGNFRDSKDYLEDGLIDSFEMIGIISSLEEAFEIEISGKDIIPENFINLDSICLLLKKYIED